jgi:tRNA dimethylallyltransferase
MKKKILCVVGPTAVGKTDIALNLAKKLNGELVSCDSRQVYRGLDIGTGKMPGQDVSFEKYERVWVIDGVPVWLYDVVLPQLQYDVWQYVQDARSVISQITEEQKLPIIVGGTGLYLKGLLNGFEQMEIPIDLNLREELEELSLEEIHQRIEKLDPDYFSSLNNSEIHNKRRLIRKIEKILLHEQAQEQFFSKGIKTDFDILKIGLSAPRDILYSRIDQRVIKRVKNGMIEEAKKLQLDGISFERMRQLGLEYSLLADFLEGIIPTEEKFIEKLQFRIHQYAKRQLTWFHADSEIEWFDITDKGFEHSIESHVMDWYNR